MLCSKTTGVSRHRNVRADRGPRTGGPPHADRAGKGHAHGWLSHRWTALRPPHRMSAAALLSPPGRSAPGLGAVDEGGRSDRVPADGRLPGARPAGRVCARGGFGRDSWSCGRWAEPHASTAGACSTLPINLR